MADRVACFFVVLGFVWGVDRGAIWTAVTCLLEPDGHLLQIKSWATLCIFGKRRRRRRNILGMMEG